MKRERIFIPYRQLYCHIHGKDMSVFENFYIRPLIYNNTPNSLTYSRVGSYGQCILVLYYIILYYTRGPYIPRC